MDLETAGVSPFDCKTVSRIIVSFLIKFDAQVSSTFDSAVELRSTQVVI